jgi:phosphatidylinositol-bisphosphatase
MGSLSSGVQQSLYKSHPEITQSDHRPVSASFKVDVRPLSHYTIPRAHDEQVARVNTDAYDKAVKDLWRKVAGIEDAEDLPQLEISHAVIELGKIL